MVHVEIAPLVPLPFQVAALYQFHEFLEDPAVLRPLDQGLVWQILAFAARCCCAREGINGTISGADAAADLIGQLRGSAGLYGAGGEQQPGEGSTRLGVAKVKLGREIVTMNAGVSLDPWRAVAGDGIRAAGTGNALIFDPDVIVIDTSQRL